MAPSFIFGGNTGETPQSVKRKRDLAMAIMGASAAPRNVGEGLNALGSGIVAGIMNRRADKAEKSGRAGADSVFQGIVNRITGQAPDADGSRMVSTGAGPASTGPVSSQSSAYRDAIASIESAGSGGYKAVGPTHPKMGRALGRYQIMEANVGPWSREVLGREVSPDEFMADARIQDAIFDGKFNSYVQQFGPEGAAQAWFAGPGGVGKTDRKDTLGTDTGTYGRKFMRALGSQGQPQKAAGRDPSIGMPHQTAAGAVNAMSAGISSPSASLSEEVAAFEQTPEYRAQFPGMNVPQGIPAQFQASRKLANAQGGIMPALMGGAPASPEQIAEAQAIGQQQAPQAPTRMELLQALGNPFLSEEQRAILQTLHQQQVQQSDPVRLMELERGRLEIDAMRNGEWSKLDDGRLYNQRTGEVRGTRTKPNACLPNLP
jgi:hypothetical protein